MTIRSPWHVGVMDPGAVDAVTVTDGETIKHIRVGDNGSFEIVATAFKRSDLDVSVQGPSKRPVAYRLLDEGSGLYRVEFTTTEVGNYFVDLAVGGAKVPGSPFISKAYDADLIRVTDVPNGVVGQACQFKVDASHAGEGQLEISICDGEVPNQVQVLGGGRCLVSFTPERAMKHTIDIKFNGDTVRGCPFVCNVTDTSRVSVNLRQLELIAVDKPASFLIQVDGSTSAELAVSVREFVD
ncbi:unnamed protein product [Cyprideis torosa]|uniref:Uncharacterized protein n=1 Tax=Cyprideis torosa TaxID=163714 RepID=A0A7R8WN85_9CRUS|nr:unnamed protein product [Cyprideis torosa]CAG0900138.1 unnamed protein product [Cyprideis torosa]